MAPKSGVAPPSAGGSEQRRSEERLARAVFFNRLGELRDRTFENQRYRASGLNLLVAAIVLWNTVYLERAIKGLREAGQLVKDSLLTHLSPLGWEHINLIGTMSGTPINESRKVAFGPCGRPKTRIHICLREVLQLCRNGRIKLDRYGPRTLRRRFVQVAPI